MSSSSFWCPAMNFWRRGEFFGQGVRKRDRPESRSLFGPPPQSTSKPKDIFVFEGTFNPNRREFEFLSRPPPRSSTSKPKDVFVFKGMFNPDRREFEFEFPFGPSSPQLFPSTTTGPKAVITYNDISRALREHGGVVSNNTNYSPMAPVAESVPFTDQLQTIKHLLLLHAGVPALNRMREGDSDDSEDEDEDQDDEDDDEEKWPQTWVPTRQRPYSGTFSLNYESDENEDEDEDDCLTSPYPSGQSLSSVFIFRGR